MSLRVVSFAHALAAAHDLAPQSDYSQRGRRIGVIGAGASGVLVTLHLLWRCRPNDRIYLVERSERLGTGLAYGTENPDHLLNVRIENMSAFGDEPDHFARWLGGLAEADRAAAGIDSAAGRFVRRQVYGAYIQHLLLDAITRLGGGRNLHLLMDEATGARREGDEIVLATAGGVPYRLDALVLALGNFPPAQPDLPGYFANPWQPAAVQGLDPSRPVLLIGSGLTMVDVCLALQGQGHQGTILALSRRGLAPLEHAPAPAWPDLRISAADRRSVASLCQAVRREVRRAAAAGVGWHSVVDALRPHVQLLWQELTTDQRARFLRHLRPWWESHRHRLAPPVAARIAAARASGRLRLEAGRLAEITPHGRDLSVRWRPRGTEELRQLMVQRVIDCSGPMTDVTRLTDPLLVQLLASGQVCPDPHRLGLHATRAGALIGADGKVTPRLFGLGPILRGALWEITSVPDIRELAEQVAEAALRSAEQVARRRQIR